MAVKKERGETKIARIENAADLKKILKDLELRLGEYYYSDGLGGVP